MDQLDEALARSRRDDLVAATRPWRPAGSGRTPVANLRRGRALRRRRADEL